MSEMQNPMLGHLPTLVYWTDNQVVLTFLSNEPTSVGTDHIIQSLHLDRVNAFLNSKDFNLRSFTKDDVPQAPSEEDEGEEPGETLLQEGVEIIGKGIETIGEGVEVLGEKVEELGETIIDRVEKGEDGESQGDEDEDDSKGLNSPVGKYLFAAGSDTYVISFFHVERKNGDGKDNTVEVVNLLNDPSAQSTLQKQDVPSFTAMPNWYNGGSQGDRATQGCPTDPPYPVEDLCASGRWSFSFEQALPESLQTATGAGVRVFVLDTLPLKDSISIASEGAGNNNTLLGDLVTGMTDGPDFNAGPPGINIHYQVLPVGLNIPTGKDIYGRLVGFPVVDHGLFIAGIIRDLTPEAEIECVRVLNDFGAGNTTMLIDALQNILQRMDEDKNLNNKRIVINLSLVTTPTPGDPVNTQFNDQDKVREAIFVAIRSLANRGVVFAASAGNEADVREGDPAMGPSGRRPSALYPAAFAYYGSEPINEMIPVGAVDSSGDATSYSCYPGPYGIATYGGSLLMPEEPLSEPHAVTHVRRPIDATRGVYSSTLYPALSRDDTEPFESPPPPNYPEYAAPNSNAWAYWSGTSFATPIISALAARILQGQPPDIGDTGTVRQAILNAAGDNTTQWDRLDPSVNPGGSVSGPLIMAQQQCQAERPPVIE